LLKKVEITNFKNFNEKFTFDLSKTNNFEFNKECIQNGIVNTGIIYGQNGCGKSNLGLAIFDLISHLTDKGFIKEKYFNYLNAESIQDKASFKFIFIFNNIEVVYEYSKKDYQTLVSEKLTIDNKIFAYIDREKSSKFKVKAKGAENLKNDVGNSNISILSYIDKNTILDENTINDTFIIFKKFVNNMLLTKTLDEIFYLGYEQGFWNVDNDIVNRGNLKDFENFLNNAGIKCKLNTKKINGESRIFFIHKNKDLDFWQTASSGTKSLIIFYFWYQRLRDNKDVSFLFIDEFDAFFHHDLSKLVLEMLKNIDTQVILTTHNTSNISNDLLRPDCYFIMDDKKITSLKDRTHKELREAHNIEKMYRAGAFE
jgi:AAA15 family ATPase/GTPase